MAQNQAIVHVVETLSAGAWILSLTQDMDCPELISVIIPVYNAEDFLERCLDSVTCQTYTNIEIIVVIDGATDRSVAIAFEKAGQDSRIVVIETPNNGPGKARNIGLERAHGRYIGFVDADDWIEPDMYGFLYRLLKENDADISVCSNFIDKNGKSRARLFSDDLVVMNRRQALERLAEDRIVKSYSCDKLYKVSLFATLRYPESSVYEDIAFLYRVFDKAECIVMKAVPKYHYCMRSDSRSGDKCDARNRYDRFMAEYGQMQFMMENGLFAQAPVSLVRRGIHSVNHLSESGGHEDWITDICRLMAPYRRIAGKDGGCLLRLRLWMIYGHLPLYERLYRLYGRVFHPHHAR